MRRSSVLPINLDRRGRSSKGPSRTLRARHLATRFPRKGLLLILLTLRQLLSFNSNRVNVIIASSIGRGNLNLYGLTLRGRVAEDL